jgi:AraC-like DNA-binding protein
LRYTNDVRQRPPITHAWQSRLGLVEEYEYPRGRADALPVHAHREMQVCLSLDFPGRYAYRGRLHDVPAGAVSVIDSWEPHAASDPCDRDRLSHYVVMYFDPEVFRSSMEWKASAPIDRPVRTDADTVQRFLALHRALSSDASPLEQDERCDALASRLLNGGVRPVPKPSVASLVRARDYIAAHAVERIGVRDAARQADLSPWHFVRAFGRLFGTPPHQFQLWMRIDIARRLLAAGVSGSEVAQRTGFADQSHFVRSFKRLLHTTPARYRGRPPSKPS